MRSERFRIDNRLTAGEVVERNRARGRHVPDWEAVGWSSRHSVDASPSEITSPTGVVDGARRRRASRVVRPPDSGSRPARGRHARPTEPDRPAGRRFPRGLVRLTRAAMVLVTASVVGATGLAWAETSRVVDGFQNSKALDRQGPGSSGGAENILLMGLDTRKDLHGDDLPEERLAQLHAGDGQEGGYNTNTLILVHIPADKKKIVAFSIPRDDLVAMEGVDVPKAKIKEAYGRKKVLTEDELSAEGVTDREELETRGREAGRAQTVKTVRALTGVPIDRFAEVSLSGFYDLAKALNGVKVCLKHDVSDSYSGADFHRGVQSLNAKQALAFVRQRHGLDNGDLDRTHRQQAFMLSALGQLRDAGTFTDVGKINALIAAAQRNVVLSDGWNLLDWAQTMGTVSDQRVSFTTLPVERYGTFDGQDVNIVDPATIRDKVQRAFGTKPGHRGPSSRVTPSAGSDSASTSASEPAPDSGAAVTNGDHVPCVN